MLRSAVGMTHVLRCRLVMHSGKKIMKHRLGFTQKSTSIEAQCGTACLPTGDCHTRQVTHVTRKETFSGLKDVKNVGHIQLTNAHDSFH